ncbi:MAG: Gfo/Idh/MocA family oxidoreductase [Clostridia bacterium]|nr:Gfo/Idh/MocA family oxidoreductase [Clostridia bacterium]
MLKFAVIGVGRMGKRHAFNLAHGLLGGVKLQAVCDIDAKALDWCKAHAKRAHRYSDYKKMIESEKLDGVIIATPHYSHEEIAVYLIKHGVNTLIEKPASPTVSMAKHIAEVAAAHPEVKAGISYNQRSNRMYKKAKELISSGKLGFIQRVNFIITDWYRSQAYYNQGGWRASYVGEGGGCLMNQCIHQLDVLQWLIGMPKAITARTHTVDRNITVENDVAAILEYDGFDCTFTASTHEIKGVNRLEIACDKGRLVIGPRRMKIYRHKSQVAVNKETKFGYGATPSRSSVYGYGCIRFIADIVKGQQLRSLRAFAKEIKGKGKMLAYAHEGERALQIINGIYLSAYKNESVNIPLNEGEYADYLADRIEWEKTKK